MPNPLSVREVAERTGIPKRTIQHHIAIGRLKAHKFVGVTGAFLINPADLDDYLASRVGEVTTVFKRRRDPRAS